MIPLRTRAGIRWQMVWQGPCLGFVAETGDLLLWRRLVYDFLACFCALLHTFRFSFLSFLIFFPASRYVYLLRVPSSVQQPSATLSKYAFYSTCSFCLCHLYSTPSRNYFVLYSFSFFFSWLVFLGWRFFCCALVPGTLALDLPTLILATFGFSLFHYL